ncbi:amino acid permease 7 [Hibiscus trionum]|uniref:Amino acid permease 7 n=1 Tax=Hibiscus trionum TaxID=183268 RepID=A0A9W7JA74_HIBTR|nr:amino acid permease 7 [Hibiscus trionum]
MGEEEEDNPLVASSSTSSVKRTGTVWTAIAHIITGVIGAGVLSLAWSIAQLGWIAGPITMLVFAAITFVSTCLLCDCYMYPDPEFGPNRLTSYMDAVLYYLGEKNHKVCGLIVMESLYGTTLAYVITAASSIKAIQRSNCYHREGHGAPCSYEDTSYMLLFGAVQVVMSQIPDFHNMKWLSVVAAIMSFAYASIGFGLGFTQVIENGTIKGSTKGVPTANAVDKLWLTFQALGDIVFAYPYTVILLEIQDTLKSPPSENKTMKKASLISILITTFFYLCCGCFGYAAFGNNTPGNILTGFGFYEPYWLVDFANACIVLHLVGGYQVFSQPVFAFAERWFTEKFPNSWFTNKCYRNKLGMNPLKICFRTAYVASTTAIAMMLPYFNQVLGLLGALTFWPLVIYFPVEMYFVQKKIQPWTRKWIVLESFSFVCLLVTIVAFTGSVQGLISAKLE